MRLYLDEDIRATSLVARLTTDGHEVLPLLSASDQVVWAHAQKQAAVVLTMNVVDFVPLAEATDGHHGLMLVYRVNDPGRDVRAADIARAVACVADLCGDAPRGLILPLNQFRWQAW